MKKLAAYLLALSLIACSSPAGKGPNGAGDWTMFRGSPALTGSIDTDLPKAPQLLWSATTGTRTVASPLVKNGIVYTVTRRGQLRGYGPDGSEVFVKELGASVEATPLIVDTVLYIGTMEGNLLAIGLESREVLWEFPTEGQLSSPPMPAEYAGEAAVVVGSYDNFLYTLRRKDGALLSKFETGYYINGAVAVTDGQVAFGGCDQWLRIIDTQAGQMTDSLQLGSYVPASPVFAGKEGYVGDYEGNITHFTLKEGRILDAEAVSEGEGDSFTGLPVAGDKAVYFFRGERSLACLSRKDNAEKWVTLLKGPVGDSSPLETGNGILVCTKSGIVSILDAGTGEVKWEYDTGEDILACPAVLPGRFYILTVRGTLFCFTEKAK